MFPIWGTWVETWRFTQHLSKNPVPRRWKHSKPLTLFTFTLTFMAHGWRSNNSSHNKYDDDDHDTDSRRTTFRIRRIHDGRLTGWVTSCVETAFENRLLKERWKGHEDEEDFRPFGLTTTSKISEDLVYTEMETWSREEEDVSSYWTISKKREDTESWNRVNYMALPWEVVLKGFVDLS
jgi:hypothetical protein